MLFQIHQNCNINTVISTTKTEFGPYLFQNKTQQQLNYYYTTTTTTAAITTTTTTTTSPKIKICL